MVNRKLLKIKCVLISISKFRSFPYFLLLSRFAFIKKDLGYFLNRKIEMIMNFHVQRKEGKKGRRKGRKEGEKKDH